MPPRVTVAISTYNRRESYLREAIESVLAQTYQDLEILIADNASTTIDVEAVVRGYNDSRIRYQRHAQNIGAAANWTFCAREARGVYTTIFHDDDVMEPNHIAGYMEAVEKHPGLVFLARVPLFIDENSAPRGMDWFQLAEVPKDVPIPGKQLLNVLAAKGENHVCAPTVMVRSDVYQRCLPFSAFPLFTLDLNMWLRVLSRRGGEAMVLSPPGFLYRTHSSQATFTWTSGIFIPQNLALEFLRVLPHLDASGRRTLIRRLGPRAIRHLPSACRQWWRARSA